MCFCGGLGEAAAAVAVVSLAVRSIKKRRQAMREPTPEAVQADLFTEQDEPEEEVRSDFPPQPGDVAF